MSTQGAGSFTARELAAAMVSPKRCGGLDYPAERRTSDELIAHYKMRIIEFEKFKGPVAEDMIRHLKRRIDWLRAMHGTASSDHQEASPPVR